LANEVDDAMNDQLAYNITEACEVARTGRTALYEAINDGSVCARKHGRLTSRCVGRVRILAYFAYIVFSARRESRLAL